MVLTVDELNKRVADLEFGATLQAEQLRQWIVECHARQQGFELQLVELCRRQEQLQESSCREASVFDLDKKSNFASAASLVDLETKFEKRLEHVEMIIGVVEKVEAQERQVKDVVSDGNSIRRSVEKFMIQKHLLQDLVKDVTSIKSTQADLKTEMVDQLRQMETRLLSPVMANMEDQLRQMEMRLPKMESKVTEKSHAGNAAQLEDLSGPDQERSALDDALDRVAAVEARQEKLEDFQRQFKDVFDKADSEILEQQAAKNDVCEMNGKTNMSETHEQDVAVTRPGIVASAKKLASDQAKDCVEADVEYKWQKSVWDAAIFIHTSAMPLAVSFSVALFLIFLLCFVMLSVNLCYEIAWDKDFDENSREDFSIWRTNVAHDVGLRDKVSGRSLARNVCDGNYAIPYATVQIDAVTTIQSYMGTRFQPMPLGKVVCCIALGIWYLTLGLELNSIADVVQAFSYLPVEQRTRLLPDPKDHSIIPEIRLVSVSGGRLAFLILLGLLRLAVVVLLCLIGTLYLCFETSPENMLLNSLAMQVILNFDELLYESLMPYMAQVAMTRIRPLRYTRKQSPSIMLGILLMKLSLFFALLYLSILFVLDPFVADILDNKDALCGGVDSSLDFVMAVDSIGIPWAAATPNKSDALMTFARIAVLQVMRDGFVQTREQLAATERSNLGYFMKIASGFTLESLVREGNMFKHPKDWEVLSVERASGIVGWNEIGVFKDQDFGDALGTVYNNYLNFLMGSLRPGTMTCSDVTAERCYSHGGFSHDVVMRQLCPKRCGCDSPSSGSVSSAFSVESRFGFMGCGLVNLRRSNFVKELSELACHDTDSSDTFAAWVQGVGNALSHNSSYRMMIDEMVDNFNHGGCPEVVKTDLGTRTMSNICDESSLPAICPKSCGCIIGAVWTVTDAQRKDYCPYNCEAQKPPCVTIDLNRDADDLLSAGNRYLRGGYACLFPFRYEGQLYHNCTDVDWDGLWCPVTVRNNDLQVEFWGDCPASC